MRRTLWILSSLTSLGLLGSACNVRTCTLMGKETPVTVALVDDAGAPVLAQGEVQYSRDREATFDCAASPLDNGNDALCQEGVLRLQPISTPTDTIALRFRLDDGSFTDWLPVDLTIRSVTDKNFNGPGCDFTSYVGTAEPVVVPPAARLPR